MIVIKGSGGINPGICPRLSISYRYLEKLINARFSIYSTVEKWFRAWFCVVILDTRHYFTPHSATFFLAFWGGFFWGGGYFFVISVFNCDKQIVFVIFFFSQCQCGVVRHHQHKYLIGFYLPLMCYMDKKKQDYIVHICTPKFLLHSYIDNTRTSQLMSCTESRRCNKCY